MKKYQDTALMAAAFIILAYIVYKVLGNTAKGIKQTIDDNKGREVDVNNSDLYSNVNYDGIALQMRNALYGIFQTAAEKTTVIDIWLSMNDEEFKHLCNIYNSRHVEAPATIRNDIEGEIAINPFKRSEFIDRMNILNLA